MRTVDKTICLPASMTLATDQPGNRAERPAGRCRRLPAPCASAAGASAVRSWAVDRLLAATTPGQNRGLSRYRDQT